MQIIPSSHELWARTEKTSRPTPHPPAPRPPGPDGNLGLEATGNLSAPAEERQRAPRLPCLSLDGPRPRDPPDTPHVGSTRVRPPQGVLGAARPHPASQPPAGPEAATLHGNEGQGASSTGLPLEGCGPAHLGLPHVAACGTSAGHLPRQA